MNDLSKLIVGVFLTFAVSMVTYLIQFRRNKRIEYKAHIHSLYNLIFETIKTGEYQIEKTSEFKDKVINNIEVVPLLVIPSYPASKYLHEKVLKDDCYISFIRLFSNVIDSRQAFFSLKINAVTFDRLVEQIQDIAERSIKEFRDKTIEFRDLYYNVIEEIEALTRLPNLAMHDKILVQQFYNTYTKFLLSREPNDGNGNLREINTNFTVPLLKIFEGLNIDSLYISLLGSLQKLYRLYKGIVKSNKDLVQVINSLIPLLHSSYEQIVITYNGLSKNPYYLSQ